ncbi:MAG: hypothetical protein A3I07_02760 [Candidatus Doudnabacteria bacterium RIFCSPLOWO2_02_FULL_42_9]|nr:MAG: hypothetical protein A3K07_02045 [Candidatus Doudnabacteria bacterium RIFCSPHIGHO2_01_43_10]OGE85387.1 MAG: hypothetical protein A3E28_01860 [Candidatus Doudnabacteria bacterium RIFCSPHIGHO2_12_FULL_42_22]OGE86925.1 MAG: hypothetical protein A3C49_02695 [Candidatus Doudnabacteria bacterium RIFCSPHIGHO2_02_FULL_42_25]OGE93004.1 MAG: hypothetical protein A3K08_00135 [Candidatus Doudnabacteria bacterium RIFCSPLOWO2_01_41_7]OGE98259.1 MAG: hypothetical protein A3G89_00575 [Candidatus Doudna
MERNVKIGIIAVVLLFVGFFAYTMIQDRADKPNFVNEVNRTLTDEQRKIYLDRLAEGERKLTEANTDLEKYEAYIVIGNQKYGLGQLGKAKEDYLKAERYNVENQAGVYTLLYQVELEMQDYESAKEHILKALELGAGTPDIWIKYITLMKEYFNANSEQLDKIFQDALAAVPDKTEIDIVTRYAQFLEETRNLKDAIGYWQKAIELFPLRKSLYQAEIDRLEKLIE